MLHLSPSMRYYLYRLPADMRKSFDSLSGLISSGMHLNVMDGDLFIFINRPRTHIKILMWEGDGFALYYKRLEQGTYELPPIVPDSISMVITYQQLQLILQGIALQKIVYRRRLRKSG